MATNFVRSWKSEAKDSLSYKKGSMYPVLYRLTEKGLVSTRKELVGKRRTRVYYHIEPDGIAYMKENAKAYFSIHNGILEILKTVGENYDREQ